MDAAMREVGPMTWVRLDDQFPDHPKALAVGPMGCWLYVCGIAYANRYLTDGFIPDRQARRLMDAEEIEPIIDQLVNVGLWERCANGYRIHDYLDYQPSAEKVKADRDAARQRSANRRGTSRDVPTNISDRSEEVRANFGGDSEEIRLPHPIPIPIPNPLPETQSTPASSARSRVGKGLTADKALTDAFEAFWTTYPRKTAKQDALKAWLKLAPDAVTQLAITAAVSIQCESAEWAKDGGQFIPYAATWLNGRRWEDQLKPRQDRPAGPEPFNPTAYATRRQA